MRRRDDVPSLLLLPFPPDPLSRQTLNAAYRPSLMAALSRLKNPTRQSKLIVAVACPIVHGQFVRSRTVSWTEAQSLIAGVYTIISVICAQLDIATEYDGGPGSVESTVILLNHDRKKEFHDFKPVIETDSTVVVDLATFASAYYPWNYIFHVRSESGFALSQDFLKFAELKQSLLQEQLIPVDGGLALNLTQTELPDQDSGHGTVCLGGTFDHLHAGHKLLLTAGALLLHVPRPGSGLSKFIIGITGDELLRNKKYADQVQSWNERARAVIIFLSTLLTISPSGWKEIYQPQIVERDGEMRASFRDSTIVVQCVTIQDPFGPTVTLKEIDVLVVSGETRAGGQAVNDRRAQQGWDLLEIFEVEVLDAEEISDETTRTENYATKISSTAIRKQRSEARSSSGKV